MRIAKKYSHLNGEEYLIVHHQLLYEELTGVIETIDAEGCRSKTLSGGFEQRGQRIRALVTADCQRQQRERGAQNSKQALHWSETGVPRKRAVVFVSNSCIRRKRLILD